MISNDKYLKPEQKIKMLEYAKVNGVKKAAEKYGCTERTIFRWKKQYDGTIESLELKLDRKNMIHPNALKDAEIQIIKDCVEKNPYITDNEIIKALGTNRNRSVVRKYRNKIFGKNTLESKTDPKTMFDVYAVREINKRDIAVDLSTDCVYLIEVNKLGLYISKSKGDGYPSSFTPYYSMALKFDTAKDAENFIKEINNTSKFELSVKKIQLEKIIK